MPSVSPDTYKYEPVNEFGEPGTWIRLLILDPGDQNDPISCRLRPFNLDTLTDIPTPTQKSRMWVRIGKFLVFLAPLAVVAPLWVRAPVMSMYILVMSLLFRNLRRFEAATPHADWTSNPTVHFEALSYAWGDPKITKPITVHGKIMLVTTNLNSALRHLRYPDSSRVLWVDAICINQLDADERSSQVQYMASIYQSAPFVTAWLGDADDVSDSIFDFYRFKADMIRVQKMPVLRSGLAEIYEKMKHDMVHPDIIDKFFSRAWFQRLWTIQEMILARNLVFVCGRNTLSGVDIELCAGEDGKQLGYVSEKWTQYLTWKKTLWNEGRSLYMSQIFFADRLCTEPRDRIFAVLGICHSVGDLIIPDYKLPVGKVFQQAVLAMVCQDHGNLRSVFRGSRFYNSDLAKREKSEAIPSWVPDFSNYGTLEVMREQKYYTKTWHSHPSTRYNKLVGAILSLRGIKFSKVLQLEKEIDVLDLDWPAKIRKWEPSNLQDKLYPTGEDRIDSYWRTLLWDTDLEHRFSQEDIQKYRKSFLEWRQMSPKNDLRQEPIWYRDGYEIPEHHKKYTLIANQFKLENKFLYALFLGAGVQGVFAQLENGYFGMVPAGTRAGDSIVVVNGPYLLPLVLRPQNKSEVIDGLDGNVGWKLVGTAYIHGIMDGEILKAARRGQYEEETIRII